MSYFTEADFKNLWKREGSAYFILPLPSDEELAALEQRLGVKLPASYIEFVSTSQNGGLLKRNGFPILDGSGNTIRHVKIDYMNAIGHRPGDESLPTHYAGHKARDMPPLFYDIPNLLEIGSILGAPYYDFFVLNYLECGTSGEPSIAFITRKVRRGKNGEPVDGIEDWRNINETYYWEVTTVAPTFDAFIKELIVMPKLPAFDFAALKAPLKQAAQKSFREIIKAHGHEKIISFGLYVDDEGSMVADAANTRAHFEKLVAENPSDKDYFAYATNEWRYEGTDFALDLFEPICNELATYSAALGSDGKMKRFRDKLLDFCTDVLAELKAEDFFAIEYNSPVLLSVGTSNGDVSTAKRKKIRALLA